MVYVGDVIPGEACPKILSCSRGQEIGVTLGTGEVLTSHGPLVAQGSGSSIDLPRGNLGIRFLLPWNLISLLALPGSFGDRESLLERAMVSFRKLLGGGIRDQI